MDLFSKEQNSMCKAQNCHTQIVTKATILRESKIYKLKKKKEKKKIGFSKVYIGYGQ